MKKLFLGLFFVFFCSFTTFAQYCPHCQYYNQDQARFCSSCGQEIYIAPQAIYCTKCGYQNPVQANFCGGCGYALNRNQSNAVGQNTTSSLNIFKRPNQKKPKKMDSVWNKVGSLYSDKESKATELPGNGESIKVKFYCVNGSHIINTLAIREGGNVTKYPITSRLAQGQEIVKDLPRTFNITGLRITHKGNGTIDVYCLKE